MKESFISFFDCPFFTIVWWLSTAILIIGLIYKLVCRLFSITPIAWRLWRAIHKKKIAIFWDDNAYNEIKSVIADSPAFREKNIEQIRINAIEKWKRYSLFIVDWDYCRDKIWDIYSMRKNEQTSIIILAKPWSIDKDIMSDIANRTNTIVVNFKWRLLNDIFNSLITTEYDS